MKIDTSNNDAAENLDSRECWTTPSFKSHDASDAEAGGPGATDAGILS